jgi:riboflavin synthase
MFTGLVEAYGTVKSLTRTHNEARLTVASDLPTAELAIGDSVSVNGACLTVIAKDNSSFTVDMSPETFDRTTFKTVGIDRKVNLERALRVGDRLGGHIVTGHIDTVGTVAAVDKQQNAIIVRVEIPPEHGRYIVPKGSVAIDGISLTVNEAEAGFFSVSIIPHTLASTTLADCRKGDLVNIETDILGKYIERLLGINRGDEKPSQMTSDFLAKHGFM